MADASPQARFDRLWVPPITHYRATSPPGRLDPIRMKAHLSSLRPAVSSYLLGGSTGDGWQLQRDQFDSLIDLMQDPAAFPSGSTVMLGVLRHATAEVVDAARHAEHRLAAKPMSGASFAGFAICPPVDPAATPRQILQHYGAILAATSSPIAVYELPQVTGCSIDPATLGALAREPRVAMLKDTSGQDILARSGAAPGLTKLRGAEGGYLPALKPGGPYDGWLLSTGNAFAPVLRRILALQDDGMMREAALLSDTLSAAVATLFAGAADLTFGNPFSNANRAADHILAYGEAWRNSPPPVTISGDRLPFSLSSVAERVLQECGLYRGSGYLADMAKQGGHDV
jgi:dihydrodipicolinate synthase/N-acetylneuraminate lyase